MSILINLVFIRAIYISKADCDKYIVLDKEEYKNAQSKKYEKYYCVLKTLENNLKISDIIISNTIKNENGEEDKQLKAAAKPKAVARPKVVKKADAEPVNQQGKSNEA